MAAYLRGGAEEKATADRILERLAVPQAHTPALDIPQPAEAVDQQKLEALAKPAEPEPAKPKTPREQERAADLEKANEKLSSLLGNPKSE